MLDELKELWRFRELLFTMVQRDLKIRYKNSILGFFWSLINPLITVLVMTFVVSNFMNSGVPSQSAYILAAYLPFIFFQACLMDSAQTILVAMPLIKKIYFPREILPLATVLANFVHFCAAFGVFFLYELLFWALHPGISPFRLTALFLPLILLINLALSIGLAFFISALNTFYEDVKYMLSIALYLLLFLCPVMYTSTKIADSAINDRYHGLVFKLYHLNPMAMLCTTYRHILLAPADPAHDWFELKYLAFTAVVSIAILITGYHFFNRMKWRFVERP